MRRIQTQQNIRATNAPRPAKAPTETPTACPLVSVLEICGAPDVVSFFAAELALLLGRSDVVEDADVVIREVEALEFLRVTEVVLVNNDVGDDDRGEVELEPVCAGAVVVTRSAVAVWKEVSTVCVATTALDWFEQTP